MLTTINTAYIDTRSGDLAWSLGMTALPALAVVDRELGPPHKRVYVQMRLLGASHQVLIDSSNGGCSETVACIPGSTAPLPFGVARRIGVWDYEFAARVETLSPGSFAGRAQELLALVADHPNGLAGTFPGDPNAFTAMLVQYREGGVRWRTWHAYPQEARLVATRSRLCALLPKEPKEAGRPAPPGMARSAALPRAPERHRARQ